MTGVGDDSRGRAVGGPWFVVGVTLAGGATIALVMADDTRYLRLGIVAALWAALVGGFLAVRYRKQATSTEDAVAQAQEIYELELEREIAARREFELELESEVRERRDEDARKELEDLRAEIGALRDSLQSLFGGEVLLERLSLTAQATRMRALREEQKLVDSSRQGPASRPALPPVKKPEGVDRPTEMMDRVRDKPVGRPAMARPAAPEPRRPERSMDLPPRRVAKSEPAPPPRQNPGGAARAEDRGERTRFQTRATPPPPSRKQPPTEMTRPAFGRAERSRPSIPAVEQPTQESPALDEDATPPWENKTATGLPPVRQAPAAGGLRRGAAEPAPARGLREDRQKPAPPPERRPLQRERRVDTRGGLAPVERERRVDTRGGLAPVERERRVDTRGGLAPVERSSPPAEVRSFRSSAERSPAAGRELEKLTKPPRKTSAVNNPTLPEEARRLAAQGRPGGRRRRPEEDTPPPAEPAGGRRRRAEGQTSSWMQPAGESGRTRAGRSRPEMEPARRAEPEDTGSHSAGRSVSELLAANGGSPSGPPRRRRRAED
ncbi:DUF6779 domain-containing protein [Amycolatopsis pigmentata]|uniref:DUF6779 domain-containing protein n=1 Tax=Amycolatopsis pigmentata TaxID=450801 RepID=A0ABW5FR87_9PSEU